MKIVRSQNCYITLLIFFDLKQCNQVFNQNNRLLDLVFSTLDCRVQREDIPFVKEDLYHPAISITCTIKCGDVTQDNFPVNCGEFRFNYKKANFPALYSDLLNADWNLEEVDNVDLRCDMFYEKLFTIFRNNVPLVKGGHSERRH